MTTLMFPNLTANTTNKDTILVLWHQPWVEATHSAAKLQRVWLETVNEALRYELDFISTVAPIYSKLTCCMLGFEGPQTPASMAACYHSIAGDMTEATFNRMRKVSELSEDLRERIWCEL
ncbi:hypothetical protein [Halomonas sp. TD01]|uniref:hypothetical protein n=1 Tax=Halomonas sp. TD01 TaxID=999141 RepID=UPI000214E5D7|nr:hypothetical protein [Halomonas sp. TD01]EGP18527.1 hypothetical protein GME_16347 [Halomonas sp. TD01]CAH1044577.1 hypothetical protein HPTD01_3055 [Halomonas sp. TD01]